MEKAVNSINKYEEAVKKVSYIIWALFKARKNVTNKKVTVKVVMRLEGHKN